MTGDHQLSTGTHAKVMRAVLSGKRQAITITPTSEDIKAAQALLQIAARLEHECIL